MPPVPPAQRMGELHEIYLAEINGGARTRGSGSQWHDQGDGRDNHDAPFAFCWDGKSTKGKQVAVTLDMIAKIREQAQGERPQIGLRWYGNEALDIILEDWVAVQGRDFEEMKQAAAGHVLLEAEARERFGLSLHDVIRRLAQREDADHGDAPDEITRLRGELESARGELDAIREEVAVLRRQALHIVTRTDQAEAAAETLETAAAGFRDGQGRAVLDRLKKAEAEAAYYREVATASRQGRVIPPSVPRLPWTVIYRTKISGRAETAGIRWDREGRMTPFTPGSVRVERTGVNRPRLVVDDIRVPDGDLYTDGMLIARVCAGDPRIEAG